MARFAVVDANNSIVGFSPIQNTYNPLKGNAAHPAPWRALSCPEVVQPAFDPATQVIDTHTFTVVGSTVVEAWTVRALTPAEISTVQDGELNAFSANEIVVGTALFQHENRIRALESKAPITKAQFIAGLKALL